MIKLISKLTFACLVEIALLFFLYRALYDYFPFEQPAGNFMIDGDHYWITPITYVIGTIVLNFLFFYKGNLSNRKLSLYALIFAILAMLIFTTVYACHTSPSFYFMFTPKIGVYFFCWLLLGAAIQCGGFYLMSLLMKGL